MKSNQQEKGTFLISFLSRTLYLLMILLLSVIIFYWTDIITKSELIWISIYLLIFFIFIRLLNLDFFMKAKRYDKIAKFLEIHEDGNFEEQNRFLHNLVFPDDINDKNFEVYSRSIPQTFLGGDLIFQGYDKDNNYWFGIGDSSGHDINSHLYSVSIQNRISYLINLCNTPLDINREINRGLSKKIKDKNLLLNNYASLLLLKSDSIGNFLYYGQHPNMILYRAKSNETETVETAGNFIGLELNSKLDSNKQFSMNSGDILFTFTDGIFEQKNTEGKYYGIKLYQFIKNEDKSSLKDFSKKLFDEILLYTDNNLKDDMSVLIIKKK